MSRLKSSIIEFKKMILFFNTKLYRFTYLKRNILTSLISLSIDDMSHARYVRRFLLRHGMSFRVIFYGVTVQIKDAREYYLDIR